MIIWWVYCFASRGTHYRMQHPKRTTSIQVYLQHLGGSFGAEYYYHTSERIVNYFFGQRRLQDHSKTNNQSRPAANKRSTYHRTNNGWLYIDQPLTTRLASLYCVLLRFWTRFYPFLCCGGMRNICSTIVRILAQYCNTTSFKPRS